MFLFLNQQYRKTNDYKNTCIDIKNFREGLPNNIQIVNTGSTYSKFAFASCVDLKLNAGDFSLQSQSLEIDNAILHQYVDHIAQGGVVIIVVAAVSLLLYREKGDNLLYYQILKDKNNPHYSWKGKIKSMFPLTINPRKVKKLLIDADEYEDIYDSFPVHMNAQKSEEELKKLVDVWKRLFNLDDLQSAELSDDNIANIKRNQQYLAEMIDFCKSKKLKPVVVVTPFSEKLNCYFSTEFKDKVINETIRNVTDSRNVPFLNYQDDAEFQNSSELFADGGFRLNKRGSKIFIQRLAKDLQNYGIYISNEKMGRK
jgi:hypothetical protein